MVANFHGTETLRKVRVLIPDDAKRWLRREAQAQWSLQNRLGPAWQAQVEAASLATAGIALPDLAPCEALMIEIR